MKKIICVVLAVLFIASVAFTATAWEIYHPSKYTMMGDVTADQTVNAKDALEILKFSVSKYRYFPPEDPTPEQLLKYERQEFYRNILKIIGDANGDERVDAQDALHILQYAVGKRDVFENMDLSALMTLQFPVTPTDITKTDV